MTACEIKDKTVFNELYILKGIAIIGVIIWHTYHTPLPLLNETFSNFLWKIIATYSMPMFMFASGFLFGQSKREISTVSSYVDFIRAKFKRIMIPYFAVWGIYITAEFAAELASGFTSLDYHVDRNFWKYILLNPINGRALHLWFLHQLFIVFLVFPLLKKRMRNPFALFIFICSLWIIPIPHGAFIDLINLRIFLFFFSFGYLYAHCDFNSINAYSKSLSVLSLILMVTFSVYGSEIGIFFADLGIESELFYLNLINIEHALGVIFFYYLSVILKNSGRSFANILKYLGVYSFSIYLFHHISLGIVRITLLKVMNANESMYVIASIIVFLAGLILPILLVKYFINRFKFLPTLLLGVKKVPQFAKI